MTVWNMVSIIGIILYTRGQQTFSVKNYINVFDFVNQKFSVTAAQLCCIAQNAWRQHINK